MTAKRNRLAVNEAASGAQGPELTPQNTPSTDSPAGSPRGPLSVSVRAPSAGQAAAVILTPRKGPALALESSEAWDLHKALMNAVLGLDHQARESALAATIRSAKAAERRARNG